MERVRYRVKTLRTLAFWVALAALVVSVRAASGAETGPPVDPRKKLIVYAVCAFRPDTVGAHIADLGKDYPGLAGFAFFFWPDDWKYIHMGGRHGLFSPRPYAREDFHKVIAELGAVDFAALTENFFVITTTVGATPEMPATPEETLNIDWFDDRWPTPTPT